MLKGASIISMYYSDHPYWGHPVTLFSISGSSLAPHFVDHDYCSKLAGDDLTNTSVLGVDEDGNAVFAAGVTHEDTTDVEITTAAKFTDLRMGLFMVDQATAHQLRYSKNKLKISRITQGIPKFEKETVFHFK